MLSTRQSILLNPKLYEINTRVWIKRFGKDVKLSAIPDEYFRKLAGLGINIIWLMGIWKTQPAVIERCCFSTDLIASYNKAFHKVVNTESDWKKEDVIGSPYAIDVYEVNPQLGTFDDLKKLREQLSKLGIKLFLDFIPNHFSSASKLIDTNPELFLRADEELLSNDPATFFKPEDSKPGIFAHGRDPFFPAWTDTVQLNYFNPETRNFMTQVLLNISDICDGVRCDMSILILNNVFSNTWMGVLNRSGYEKPGEEFWTEAIKKVKSKSNDFIFLAEAYWDLEWDLQQLGFDFTYDKRLTDRLSSGDVYGVRAHLDADISFQQKSVRFLENHDEQRAVTKFGEHKSLAAAVTISTIPGMKFYFDGQFEGKKTRLPLQLGREPFEKPCELVRNFYQKLLLVVKDKIFTDGEFKRLDAISPGSGNNSYENIFAFMWKLDNEMRVIVINYSGTASQCRIIFDPGTKETRNWSQREKITLTDLLTGESYIRKVEEIKNPGLYVELKGYRSHIFSVTN